jgi:hypothetical protein
VRTVVVETLVQLLEVGEAGSKLGVRFERFVQEVDAGVAGGAPIATRCRDRQRLGGLAIQELIEGQERATPDSQRSRHSVPCAAGPGQVLRTVLCRYSA